MATVYYTVKKGDTLGSIAKKYNTTATNLAKLNKIKNVNYIVVGQKLIISGASSSSSSSSSGSTSSSSNKVRIDAFGLQSNTDNTLYATWSWGKSNTDHYMVIWYYDTGDKYWFVGSDSSTNDKYSLYTIPNNALRVKLIVKPISETYKKNDKDVKYWSADWSTAVIYDVKNVPPATPAIPSITMEDFKLTCSMSNIEDGTTSIEFEIVQNDKTIYKKGYANVYTKSASYSCNVAAGEKYKVRAKAHKSGSSSDWSAYSDNISATPTSPARFITCKATSESTVLLAWDKVTTADSYTIEYTEKKEYFEGSNALTAVTGIDTTKYYLTGLDGGKRYYFRVKAVNTQGDSSWSAIESCVVGSAPAAPTTWSSTSTGVVGENLILYWIHNAEDGSAQSKAELEVYVNNTKHTYTINTPTASDKNETQQYKLSTTGYTEGAVIKWRVRTAGIIDTYGDWSIQRVTTVYAPPTVSVNITDNAGLYFTILKGFPFYINAIPGPKSQKPISYYVTITSNTNYETIDEIGVEKVVRVGDEVYSEYYNTNNNLTLKISADSIDLENNASYTLKVLVTMDSGLTAEESINFTVAWDDPIYQPNAEIGYDPKTYTTTIRPYCSVYDTEYYKVTLQSNKYIVTNEKLYNMQGTSINDAFTDMDEIVYLSDSDKTTMFIVRTSETPRLVTGIRLSVYRRDYDGSFVEIGSKIDNTKNTFITDPHPSLDIARYRIIAIDDRTGGVSYTDLPGYPIHEKSVIIQWSETWSNFDVNHNEVYEEPAWAGSLISIPYNIDVSDKNTNDVSLANYIGRKHPVSYYGTHVGYKSTWNMVIPKSDKVTLYALRRLAVWMGDVYVREPSGSGYWASISVSFSQTHDQMVIPVSLDITRVEGGV